MQIEPKFTPTPNWIFDNMAKMKASTFQVVMCVCRQTLGYIDPKDPNGGRKEWDKISTSQFMKAAKISNRTVIDAIATALSDGWIERRKAGDSYEYRLTPMKKVHSGYENISQANSVSYEDISQEAMKKVHSGYEETSHTKETYKEKKEVPSSSTDEAASAETTPPTDAGKEKRKTTRKSTAYVNERTGVSTADIMGAYVKVMEHAEPGASLNYGKEGIGAKRIAAEGWKPGDVVTCFWKMKNDKFWQSKHLSLQTIAEQIGATVGNGKVHNIDGHAPALAVFTGSEK